jgi:hypothetical protein
VVDTTIRRADREEPIAHAVVTYAPVFRDDTRTSAEAGGHDRP